MEKRGFTVVEIMITLIVISILLTLGVIGLRGAQAQARDSERKADIEAISRGLESRYKLGNSKNALPTTSMYPQYWQSAPSGKGNYPGINELFHTLGFDKPEFSPRLVADGYIVENLPGTSKTTLTTPSNNELDFVCIIYCQPAENQSQINAKFNDSKGKDQYLYEPIDANGSICGNGDCVRFNLYWYSEVEKSIRKVESKMQ